MRAAFSLSILYIYILSLFSSLFFFHPPATTEIYTLSLHDALPICARRAASSWRPRRRPSASPWPAGAAAEAAPRRNRSEEHTSELQSLRHLVCRLLLEKKKKKKKKTNKKQTKSLNTEQKLRENDTS